MVSKETKEGQKLTNSNTRLGVRRADHTIVTILDVCTRSIRALHAAVRHAKNTRGSPAR